jgi:hypothetical protein
VSSCRELGCNLKLFANLPLELIYETCASVGNDSGWQAIEAEDVHEMVREFSRGASY